MHGSVEGEYREAVSIGRKFLANQIINHVIVMPVRRRYDRLTPSRITPVDLLSSGRNPYLLADSLAALASGLQASVVLVDLRAGVSELNAPILLDPRVHRVFVSTISDQSVRGTRCLLAEVARRAPATKEDPICQVIVTQFKDPDHGQWVAEAAAQLGEAAAAVRVDTSDSEFSDPESKDTSTVDDTLAAEPLLSPFKEALLRLLPTWEEV